MKRTCVLALLLWPTLAVTDEPATTAAQAQPVVTPQGSPPSDAPPNPPEEVPAPPNSVVMPTSPDAQNAETGQWVYTNQYGWIWVPFGDEYVYTPTDSGADPYEYVYEPNTGWRWLIAPWVWGVGPTPYFGNGGAWRFHWYRGPTYQGRAAGQPLFRGSYATHASVSHGAGGFHGGGHVGGARR